MPHIHTEPGQHDLTSSAFILREDHGQLKVLLHTHKKLGILLRIGGHVELHETLWQGILHEIEEEAGYEKDQLHVLQPNDYFRSTAKHMIVHPLPLTINTHLFSSDSDHFHTDVVYAFMANGLPKKQPNEGESNDLRWFTADEIKSYPGNELLEDIRDLALYVFDTIYPQWKPKNIDEFAS